MLRHLELKQLRGTDHAEEKNSLMMRFLLQFGWFREFRKKLRMYREEGAPRPAFPSRRVNVVEEFVDLVLREKYGRYKRV